MTKFVSSVAIVERLIWDKCLQGQYESRFQLEVSIYRPLVMISYRTSLARANDNLFEVFVLTLAICSSHGRLDGLYQQTESKIEIHICIGFLFMNLSSGFWCGAFDKQWKILLFVRRHDVCFGGTAATRVLHM